LQVLDASPSNSPRLGEQPTFEKSMFFQRSVLSLRQFHDPLPLPNKIATSVYSIAVRLQSTISSDQVNFTSSTFARSSDHLSSDLSSFLGLGLSTAESLNTPIVCSYQELHCAAGRLLFYISASNWDFVFGRIRHRVAQLGHATDETMDMSELRVLEWCHLNQKKLSSVMQGMVSALL
jgi:hypothetical protein